MPCVLIATADGCQSISRLSEIQLELYRWIAVGCSIHTGLIYDGTRVVYGSVVGRAKNEWVVDVRIGSMTVEQRRESVTLREKKIDILKTGTTRMEGPQGRDG